MSNPEEAHFQVIEETVLGTDAENRRLAVLQTRSLLTSWRARFASNGEQALLTAEYDMHNEEHVVVRSERPELVVLEVSSKAGRVVRYDFDGTSGSLNIEIGTEGTIPGTPDESAYDSLSRRLFDCDKRELRG